MALYQEVKQQSASSLFLYDALIDYQNKHQLNSKQQVTNIEQLNKNIEKLNQLLEKIYEINHKITCTCLRFKCLSMTFEAEVFLHGSDYTKHFCNVANFT